MGAPFAWPSVFSAFALAAESDPELRRGTHLRLVPSGALGFPLAPFLVFEARTLRGDAPMMWSDAHGRAVPQADFAAAGGRLLGVLDSRADPVDVVTVALEALETGGGQVQAMRLLDHTHLRTLVARTRKRWLLAAPTPNRLALEGHGGSVTVFRYVVGAEQVFGSLDQEPAAVLGLPLDGEFPWYVHRGGRRASDERVRDGAPLLLSRPDRPDGPFDPVTADAEGARVGVHADVLESDARRLVSDERVPPWEQQTAGSVGPTVQIRRQQRVSLPLTGSLLMKGLDAGYGRFLGLAGRIERLPQDGAPPPAYVAVGIYAVEPRRRVHLRLTLGDLLGPPHEVEGRLISRAIQLLPPLEHLIGRVRQRGLDVRAVLTVAAAVPPPDTPQLTGVRQASAQWLPAPSGPSTHFQARFTLPDVPLSAQLAVGRRRDDGTWETTHATDAMPAGLTPPARPGAPPRPHAPGPRERRAARRARHRVPRPRALPAAALPLRRRRPLRPLRPARGGGRAGPRAPGAAHARAAGAGAPSARRSSR